MTPTTIRIHVRDAAAREELLRAIAETPDFSAIRNGDSAPCGVCIYEMGDDRNTDLARIRCLLESGLAAEVFVTAADKNPDLIIAAMRTGVSEFLPCPVRQQDLHAALKRFTARRNGQQHAEKPAAEEKRAGRIIHVIGGKGGVGSTTIAVNIAVEIAAQNPELPISLVDMRYPLGEVPLFLDLEYANTWGEAARDISRLDATFLASLMARYRNGLDVLPAPSRREEAEAVSPQAVATLMKQLKTSYDTVIVDGSPYPDDVSLAAMEEADTILMVLVLSLPCLANVRKLLETFDSMSPGLSGKVRLVVNRHLSKAEISVAEAEELLGRKTSWLIENDYAATLSAINQGRPLTECAPSSPVARNLARLAREIRRPEPATASRHSSGLFSRLFSRTRRPAQSAVAAQPARS
ncbi:pilus assembly protein CpaE [Desulfobaculum xiamenense]|uniref:Pilus assembly protein CpaE n=1 Tax=Desulfobaculum xiamenense TaxID=995050 RepID=A0A846QG21_9BACT|nr:MinD/ParA family protein [Desulfobaculum xiamenense]NJB67258.1 pilus assembly protein CpaE [Desulfobaculum xiamenense]